MGAEMHSKVPDGNTYATFKYLLFVKNLDLVIIKKTQKNLLEPSQVNIDNTTKVLHIANFIKLQTSLNTTVWMTGCLGNMDLFDIHEYQIKYKGFFYTEKRQMLLRAGCSGADVSGVAVGPCRTHPLTA